MNALVAVPASSLSDKHEQFVQELLSNGGRLGDAYRTVYPLTSSDRIAWINGCRLRAREDVRQRVAHLHAQAAERAIVTARQQLVDLAEMAAVDLTQLQRIVATACKQCHSLYDADLKALRPLPDMSAGLPPHASCASLAPHTRLTTLPIEQWPPAARRLLESVEVANDGSLRLTFRDRDRIQDMVNKLLGGYVSRSENITAHVQVDPSKPSPWSGAGLTPEQVLERLRRGRAPLTIEQPAPTGEDAQP